MTEIIHSYCISPDIDLQFQDSDGATGLSYERTDEIIFYDGDAEVFRMIVPGFEEWFNDYLKHAGFVECCMYPSIDMDAWNQRGIELAKIIRRQLPDEYELWYSSPFEDKDHRENRPILISKE